MKKFLKERVVNVVLRPSKLPGTTRVRVELLDWGGTNTGKC